MSEQKKRKNKLKVTTFKKIKKSGNLITQVDPQSWYVTSSSQPDKDPYLVFNSTKQEKWFCDCMAYTMNLKDDGTYKDCRHILLVKEQFNL